MSEIVSREAMQGRRANLGLAFAALLLVAALAFPLIADRYWIALGISILFWSAFSGSWNIIGGFAGQFSLAHAAFFAIGAYSSAWLYDSFRLPTAYGLVVGMVVSGIAAAVLGTLMFRYRLHGTYFAIGTLALSEILRVLAGGLPWFGGSGGIPIQLAPAWDWSLLQFQPLAYYYVFLALTVAIIVLSWWITNSRFGYQLAVVRDSEDVAESLGISPSRLKLRAFVLSAVLAAPIGTFYSQYLMFVEPTTFFGILIAIQVALPAVIGGIGTVFGPLLGSIILAFAIELSNQFSLRPGVNLFVYGAVLMFFSLAIPGGLWPLLAKRLGGAKL